MCKEIVVGDDESFGSDFFAERNYFFLKLLQTSNMLVSSSLKDKRKLPQMLNTFAKCDCEALASKMEPNPNS